MTETQIPLEGIPKPDRPKVTDEIIKAAVEKVALSTCVDAKYIMRVYSYPMDGFDIAKELIRDHVDVDRDDIDELDNINYEVEAQVDAAVKEWVREHDIQPPLPIGAKVTGRHRLGGTLTIEAILLAEAKYELKPEGQDDEATGYRRFVVEYENVTPIPMGGDSN